MTFDSSLPIFSPVLISVFAFDFFVVVDNHSIVTITHGNGCRSCKQGSRDYSHMDLLLFLAFWHVTGSSKNLIEVYISHDSLTTIQNLKVQTEIFFLDMAICCTYTTYSFRICWSLVQQNIPLFFPFQNQNLYG